MSSFKIIGKDRKTDARIGILKTKSGSIETPFFMPVATKMSVKFLTTEDLKSMNVKAIISNTYVLHLRPGERIIKKFGGIKKFMNYSGINVTDSGGFQMYSDKVYVSSNEQGVFFKNPYTQEKLFITPEKDMEIQRDIDSDIAMCLDSMPMIDVSKRKVEDSVNKTIMWAKRCKIHHDKIWKKKESKQLLFGIIQGGLHKDLRKKCSDALTKMNFDGYSIGGLALGETKEQEYKTIDYTKPFIPENKPVYLMGAGNPLEVIEAIGKGIDMFDSRFPTQNARHGTLFTSEGKLMIKNAQYKEDRNPIDRKCQCFVCRTYSRSFVRYQLRNQETVGMRLCTYHNLYYMNNLVKEARESIAKGKFQNLLSKMRKAYS